MDPKRQFVRFMPENYTGHRGPHVARRLISSGPPKLNDSLQFVLKCSKRQNFILSFDNMNTKSSSKVQLNLFQIQVRSNQV